MHIATSRAGLLGVQLKKHRVDFGSLNKTALRLGARMEKFNASVGPCYKVFESYTSNKREYESSTNSIDYGVPFGLYFVIGFHFSGSISISGVVSDLWEYFS